MTDIDSDMTLLANDPGERRSFEAAIARMNAGHGVEVDPETLEPIIFHRGMLLEASDG
ncbi:hypothetical protein GS397_10455 [Sphingobium yanoikuyae]|uniref:Uncharacterized protein n=1 Tax=Sphingobium yanoikuyae TaxID=13690 RepID=A0A6P1GH47_SPHYA|nr:hypothetical protein [Sphingobium yanoikuyae]QHD67432.1 hypothetical protein GS397_10455 [Sphingobium yanoikuyae]